MNIMLAGIFGGYEIVLILAVVLILVGIGVLVILFRASD